MLPRITFGLQFGHGCDAVETRKTSGLLPFSRTLQFGHGCDAVETMDTLSMPLKWAGFNSATVVTPWKQVRILNARKGVRCFNSATVVTPWKP